MIIQHMMFTKTYPLSQIVCVLVVRIIYGILGGYFMSSHSAVKCLVMSNMHLCSSFSCRINWKVVDSVITYADSS